MSSLPAIQFYHLLSTGLEVALPKLLEMAYGKQMNVVVQCDESQLDVLDKALWTYAPESFLPHGKMGEPDAEKQPIYLTLKGGDNPNESSLLIITHGASVDDTVNYQRVFDIFDGTDDAKVAAARKRWKSYKDAGYPLTYIQQNAAGGWDKKA